MKEVFDYVKEKEAQLELVSSIRVNHNFPAKTYDFRTNSDVDYSRVLYSSACRRLQGKMQLLIPKDDSYRNRLTHSHEVAQIAKTLAKRFGLKDTLTVQTCSLAHDLGNPPFGHAGEIFLNTCSKEPYEGNAQSFRILNAVEERHHDFNGLNLTIRTMLGIVKYFAKNDHKTQKFLYDHDYNTVEHWFTEYYISHKTVDCEIMDISDEIAYAAHDLEDALKMRYFTIDEILYEFSVSDEFNSITNKFEETVKKAKSFAAQAKAYKTSEEYSMLFRKELTSLLVHDLILDIGLVEQCLDYKELRLLAYGLKKLTFKAIQRQSDIMEYEQLGKHILERLFELYSDNAFNKNLILLPTNYRFVDVKDRMILDYIGGMTDRFAIQQYERYFGKLQDRGLYFYNNYRLEQKKPE